MGRGKRVDRPATASSGASGRPRGPLASLYHVTRRDRLEAVLTEGLRVGSERHLTVEGVWANLIYGEQPIYLASSPWLPEADDNALVAVDARGLPLVADLPSLVDCGAYLDEAGQGLWWEEGQTPAELLPFEDPVSGLVAYAELTTPGPCAEAAAAVTGSWAALASVPPERLRQVAWPS